MKTTYIQQWELGLCRYKMWGWCESVVVYFPSSLVGFEASIPTCSFYNIQDKTICPLGQQWNNENETTHRGIASGLSQVIILPFSPLWQKQYTSPLAQLGEVFSLLLELSGCGEKIFGSKTSTKNACNLGCIWCEVDSSRTTHSMCTLCRVQQTKSQ